MKRNRQTELTEVQKIGPGGFARGQFGKGALTELKLIGFSGEGSHLHRLGAVYYFAWGKAHVSDAQVPWHPHRGFEIFTYVLTGSLEHKDSLGNRSSLYAGDLQLMQTGSGMEHEETFLNTPSSFIQVWLDPNFREEIKKDPVYRRVAAADFKYTALGQTNLQQSSEMKSKRICRYVLGENSPIELHTPGVSLQELFLEPGDTWYAGLDSEYSWLALILSGKGKGMFGQYPLEFCEEEAIVFQAKQASQWSICAESSLHLISMRVLRNMSYSLFPKPRGK